MEDYTFWTRVLPFLLEAKNNSKENQTREIDYLIWTVKDQLIKQALSKDKEIRGYFERAWIKMEGSMGSVMARHMYVADIEEKFTKLIEEKRKQLEQANEINSSEGNYPIGG